MSTYEEIDQFYQSRNAEFVEIANVSLPLRYQEGVAYEIEQMRTKGGILDLKAFNLIWMEGLEAAAFLQGLVSNDINRIEIGFAQPNLISHHRGKILYHIDVFRQSEDRYLLLTDAGEGNNVGGYIDHFHIREDLELGLLNPEYVRCDLIGPHIQQTLKKNGFSQSGEWEFKGHKIITFSNTLGGLSRFTNIVPATGYLEYIQCLLEESEMDLVGFEAFDEVRIHEGIPRAGIDYTQNNFPQEASLMNHISYEKGCYIGQEPHARMYHRGHPNWQSVGVSIPADLDLEIDQKLFQEDKEVGNITSLSCVKENGLQRGIAFVKYDIVKAKESLALNPNGMPVAHQIPLATAH